MRIKMPCLALAIALTTGGCHPSDQHLIAAFERDRPKYEQLLTMAQQDSQLWRIAYDWYGDKEGHDHEAPERGLLSAERWGEYRRLFKALDLEAGVSTHQDEVLLIRSCFGLSVSGSVKGFAFLSRPPEANCKSLNAGAAPQGKGTCYRHIEGKWYLFLDRR